MNLSFYVFFDAKRCRYRARIYGDDVDTVRTAPREIFDAAKVPQDKESKRAEGLASAWAEREAAAVSAKLKAEGRGGAMSPRQVLDLMCSENPNDNEAETIRRDRISLAALESTLGRNFDLRTFGLPEMTKHRNLRRELGRSDRTIENELRFAKKLISFAVEYRRQTGVREAAVGKRMPKLEETANPQVALTEEEFGAILAAASPRDRRILIVTATTMLRLEPLLAIERSWIDFDRKWLSVPAQLQKKGNAPTRRPLSVPLSEWTLDQFRGFTASPLYWPSCVTGNPLRKLDRTIESINNHVEVRGWSMHDIRTTGHTWLRSAGADPFALSVLAGHRKSERTEVGWRITSSNMTDHYSQLFEEHLRQIVAIFDTIRPRVERLMRPAPKFHFLPRGPRGVSLLALSHELSHNDARDDASGDAAPEEVN